MDDQEQIPVSETETLSGKSDAPTDDNLLKTPESSDHPENDSLQDSAPSNMMDASQILAPQKSLEESLDTLKEYQETPEKEPPQPSVEPEVVTAETKLTVEEDPNFKGDMPENQTPPGGSPYAAPEYDNKDY